MWHKNYGSINTKYLIFNYIYLNIFLSGIISSNINCAVIHKDSDYLIRLGSAYMILSANQCTNASRDVYVRKAH